MEYLFIKTEDGSPTVRLGPTRDESSSSEAMHSLKGAFSETVYIYGTAIQLMLDEGMTPRVLSLGLGLGYVELLATGLALKQAKSLSQDAQAALLDSFGGESFELVPELRAWFTAWVYGEGDVPAEFRLTYDEILNRTATETSVEATKIRETLAGLVRDGRWKIREALTADTAFTTDFGCICFDAFSSKTSPELWSEEFLLKFFAQVCAPRCVLSTYACTGALKRSLKASGFELTIREGFSSKRDSTFAVR